MIYLKNLKVNLNKTEINSNKIKKTSVIVIISFFMLRIGNILHICFLLFRDSRSLLQVESTLHSQIIRAMAKVLPPIAMSCYLVGHMICLGMTGLAMWESEQHHLLDKYMSLERKLCHQHHQFLDFRNGIYPLTLYPLSWWWCSCPVLTLDATWVYNFIISNPELYLDLILLLRSNSDTPPDTLHVGCR